MVKYHCDTCNKNFKQKSQFTNHINKKFPCNSEEKNILINKLLREMESIRRQRYEYIKIFEEMKKINEKQRCEILKLQLQLSNKQ